MIKAVRTKSFLEIGMIMEVEDQPDHLEDTGQISSQSEAAGDDNDRA